MLATDSVMKQNMCSQPYFVSHSHAHARKHTHTHTHTHNTHTYTGVLMTFRAFREAGSVQSRRQFESLIVFLFCYIFMF